jgi:hypothetical protein
VTTEMMMMIVMMMMMIIITNERKTETGIQKEIKNDTEIWTER